MIIMRFRYPSFADRSQTKSLSLINVAERVSSLSNVHNMFIESIRKSGICKTKDINLG